MSAYAKKSRFTELCSVCDRLCCETRDGISKGVKDDGIYCKYWQHSFATGLMLNLFEWKTHAESLEAERDALREQNTKLMKAIFAARNCGIFGCCPFCGAGWESSDEKHSLTCPVPSAKAALAATKVTP